MIGGGGDGGGTEGEGVCVCEKICVKGENSFRTMTCERERTRAYLVEHLDSSHPLRTYSYF